MEDGADSILEDNIEGEFDEEFEEDLEEKTEPVEEEFDFYQCKHPERVVPYWAKRYIATVNNLSENYNKVFDTELDAEGLKEKAIRKSKYFEGETIIKFPESEKIFIQKNVLLCRPFAVKESKQVGIKIYDSLKEVHLEQFAEEVTKELIKILSENYIYLERANLPMVSGARKESFLRQQSHIEEYFITYRERDGKVVADTLYKKIIKEVVRPKICPPRYSIEPNQEGPNSPLPR